MVFAYVSVQGWIIDPYGYGFFYQPHEVVILPPHYTEIVQCSVMTCGVPVVTSAITSVILEHSILCGYSMCYFVLATNRCFNCGYKQS